MTPTRSRSSAQRHPKFFKSPSAFRAWLERNAAEATELIVGFHKTASGKASITWSEAVDEALCFGWIDGVRKRVDEHSYQIRFTPRKPASNWSAINIEKVRVLTEQGRMTPDGHAAFARRRDDTSRTYSYEQRKRAKLTPVAEARFRKQRAAWSFFAAQAPSYRQVMTWWIVSAKKETTREQRLARLIEASLDRRRL
jgi:uncharacterized protein YdeI (YjbR/CyaY-like superfamily)